MFPIIRRTTVKTSLDFVFFFISLEQKKIWHAYHYNFFCFVFIYLFIEKGILTHSKYKLSFILDRTAMFSVQGSTRKHEVIRKKTKKMVAHVDYW